MSIFSLLMEEEAESVSTNKIKNFKGVPVAEGKRARLFIEYLELAGFKFLKFQLFSPLEINTYKGCKVMFKSSKGEVLLDTDTMEIVTFYSNKLNIGFVEFDVDLPENLEDIIRNHELTGISVIHKKNAVELSVTNQKYLATLIQ